MDISKAIDGLTLSEVARAAGIPITTLWRWRDRGEIPGKGAVQEFRFRIVKEAADKLRADSEAA